MTQALFDPNGDLSPTQDDMAFVIYELPVAIPLWVKYWLSIQIAVKMGQKFAIIISSSWRQDRTSIHIIRMWESSPILIFTLSLQGSKLFFWISNPFGQWA